MSDRRKYRRYTAVMKCLDESTVCELASFAAGNLVMVLEDDGDCWWCRADADAHSGEVIYTSEIVFQHDAPIGRLGGVLEEIFGSDLDMPKLCKLAVTNQMSRPSVAVHALERIMLLENRQMFDIERIFKEKVRAAQGSLLA